MYHPKLSDRTFTRTSVLDKGNGNEKSDVHNINTQIDVGGLGARLHISENCVHALVVTQAAVAAAASAMSGRQEEKREHCLQDAPGVIIFSQQSVSVYSSTSRYLSL